MQFSFFRCFAFFSLRICVVLVLELALDLATAMLLSNASGQAWHKKSLYSDFRVPKTLTLSVFLMGRFLI